MTDADEDGAQMTRQVPFLSEDQIERDAAGLLGEYAKAWGVKIAAPISIEDIVEKHLKLGIEFDDTHRLFGVPRDHPEGDADILGAIFFDYGRIVIDESLDPEEHPSREGRYRFTLAHEGGGHWRLHRSWFAKDLAHSMLFGRGTQSVVCPSSQAKERIEWQADYYASCLLMPRELVRQAWAERFGNYNPRRLRCRDLLPIPAGLDSSTVETFQRFNRQHEDAALNSFVRPHAEQFQVSMVAMRIRLEKLGLLVRGQEAAQRNLALKS
jgi:Zn-dependent peptidase ImmA (M78 family)